MRYDQNRGYGMRFDKNSIPLEESSVDYRLRKWSCMIAWIAFCLRVTLAC
jgi:hypothetical protein